MRCRDWQARLAAFVADRRTMPFSWGVNDCCIFAADAVCAMTGQDPAAALRGYSTAIEAARLVDQHGGLRQIATDALGAEVLPVMATIGDVVLVANEGRELLAVCNLGTAIAPGEWGIVALGMNAALAAWKV